MALGIMGTLALRTRDGGLKYMQLFVRHEAHDTKVCSHKQTTELWKCTHQTPTIH